MGFFIDAGAVHPTLSREMTIVIDTITSRPKSYLLMFRTQSLDSRVFTDGAAKIWR